MNINELIKQAVEAEHPTPEQRNIRNVYWFALSLGQEIAESKIRANVATCELGRYWREQNKAIRHVLQDNECCWKAPVLPFYSEIGKSEAAS